MVILPHLKNRAKAENQESNVAYVNNFPNIVTHTLKIYRMFGIIALLVLCQHSKTWRQ